MDVLARVIAGLGHEVIAREVEVERVGPVTASERPDVAFVGLGLSSAHALELISRIVHEAACPVIAVLTASNPAYIREAARRGVFSYILHDEPEELQSAIDITLQRFTEYHNLQGAFGRRAVIEQAKGILMGRHATTPEKAFTMLSEESQHTGRRLIDIAEAVVASHLLLATTLPPGSTARQPGPGTEPPEHSEDAPRE